LPEQRGTNSLLIKVLRVLECIFPVFESNESLLGRLFIFMPHFFFGTTTLPDYLREYSTSSGWVIIHSLGHRMGEVFYENYGIQFEWLDDLVDINRAGILPMPACLMGRSPAEMMMFPGRLEK
jgi:hypothetical protein